MYNDINIIMEKYTKVTRTFPLSFNRPSEEAHSKCTLVEHMQESCIERLTLGIKVLDFHILAHQIVIDGLSALDIMHIGTKEESYMT
jgi:Xaa-Pro aminopeptidase